MRSLANMIYVVGHFKIYAVLKEMAYCSHMFIQCYNKTAQLVMYVLNKSDRATTLQLLNYTLFVAPFNCVE